MLKKSAKMFSSFSNRLHTYFDLKKIDFPMEYLRRGGSESWTNIQFIYLFYLSV